MTRTTGGYGNMVLMKHEDGFYTRYAHLLEILVQEGQTVAARAPLGRVGRSGRATTPHLHFEILTTTQRPVDPFPWIFKPE